MIFSNIYSSEEIFPADELETKVRPKLSDADMGQSSNSLLSDTASEAESLKSAASVRDVAPMSPEVRHQQDACPTTTKCTSVCMWRGGGYI